MNIKQAFDSYSEYIDEYNFNIGYMAISQKDFDNIITEEIEEKYNKIIEEIK